MALCGGRAASIYQWLGVKVKAPIHLTAPTPHLAAAQMEDNTKVLNPTNKRPEACEHLSAQTFTRTRTNFGIPFICYIAVAFFVSHFSLYAGWVCWRKVVVYLIAMELEETSAKASQAHENDPIAGYFIDTIEPRVLSAKAKQKVDRKKDETIFMTDKCGSKRCRIAGHPSRISLESIHLR